VSALRKQVVVIGGGIAGLTAAYRINTLSQHAGHPVACTLVEASPRWGGKILTHSVGDLVMEAGPDSFLSQKPWGLELCATLGLSDRLINTNSANQKTFVYSNGRMRRLPEGLVMFVPSKLGPFLRSGLLSWAGILRMGLDVAIPPRNEAGDESLASFFRRRFGRQAFARFIEPLMAGIYAGDAEQMSLQATFPRFIEMERQHGSLIRAMMASRAAGSPMPVPAKPTRSMFVTLQGGLQELTEALVAQLHAVDTTLRHSTSVDGLRVRANAQNAWTYDVLLSDGTVVSADAVIVCTPAFVAADLVRPLSPHAAGVLEGIPYASTATVSLAYEAQEVQGQIEGFGFVVPRAEGRTLLAATWTSLKWPHRAPPNQVLVRGYLGGTGREAVLQEDDLDLVARVRTELAELAGVQGEPVHYEVSRWPQAMPQYLVGHVERMGALTVALSRYPGLALAGAAYRGIGIPDCIREGTEAAKRILSAIGVRAA
jgi:oxygen-dependent protoporphyrinogen oxidase